MHQNVILNGQQKLKLNGRLFVGLSNSGFVHRKDVTLLNIRGRLDIFGDYSIGRGCRIDIGPNAVVTIGGGGYINANTTLIISHGLSVGKDCVISWNCQFLDDDFHDINYEGKKELPSNNIILGDHIWIGCGVKIYKGTHIPSGCVIAADAVVRGIFTEENSLIAGNPARIIKSNITWK